VEERCSVKKEEGRRKKKNAVPALEEIAGGDIR
jgi:hypothetical protein